MLKMCRTVPITRTLIMCSYLCPAVMLYVGVCTPPAWKPIISFSPGALFLPPWGHVGSAGTFYQRALRLRGGVRRAPRGRAPGKRAGGNEAHLQSIDIKDFKEDIGAGRKLPRDRKRDKELQEWIGDDPYNKPTEQRHPLSSSLHPLNRMAALMRMEKMKKRIERRGKGTRRRLAIAKREAMRVQRLRARAATPTALQDGAQNEKSEGRGKGKVGGIRIGQMQVQNSR